MLKYTFTNVYLIVERYCGKKNVERTELEHKITKMLTHARTHKNNFHG